MSTHSPHSSNIWHTLSLPQIHTDSAPSSVCVNYVISIWFLEDFRHTELEIGNYCMIVNPCFDLSQTLFFWLCDVLVITLNPRPMQYRLKVWIFQAFPLPMVTWKSRFVVLGAWSWGKSSIFSSSLSSECLPLRLGRWGILESSLEVVMPEI